MYVYNNMHNSITKSRVSQYNSIIHLQIFATGYDYYHYYFDYCYFYYIYYYFYYIYFYYIPFSVSLWNDLASSVFDGVVLAGFKSRANASLLA